MKAILLHNAKAGNHERPGAEQLLRAVRDAGHAVIYQSTADEGAKRMNLEGVELVIAAGGDGTVHKAALAVAERNIPLAILPLGTANNLARTFGMPANPLAFLRRLDRARRVRLDVGIAEGPWGKCPFIEAAGAGVLAQTIWSLSHPRGAAAPSVESARERLKELLTGMPACRWEVQIDEKSFFANLLLVEAMNIPSAGPNLRLAPGANPGDGLLDFVFLEESDREAFRAFLAATAADRDGLPPVKTIRGRTLQLHGPAAGRIHADDYSWPEEAAPSDQRDNAITLSVHLAPKAVEVLLPG
jgi:diacylglycerol kinase (ATP)